MKSPRRRPPVAVVLIVTAALVSACGSEPPVRVVRTPVGGRASVSTTRAEVRRYAVDAARAAGARLVVLDETKEPCGDESVEYTLDVYCIEGRFSIDVPAAGRAAVVARIRARWRARGFTILPDPAPNDVEAQVGRGATMGLQPAEHDVTLPLYVNSTCRTAPSSARPSSSSPSGSSTSSS